MECSESMLTTATSVLDIQPFRRDNSKLLACKQQSRYPHPSANLTKKEEKVFTNRRKEIPKFPIFSNKQHEQKTKEEIANKIKSKINQKLDVEIKQNRK